MKKTINTTLTLASLALAATSANAATLRVDLNGQSGPNETGYESWNFADGFSGTLNESNTFTLADTTDSTLDVNISTTTTAGSRNYGLDNLDQSGGAIGIPDVWRDLVFFNNNSSGSMMLTLDDLSAGTYDFTSYSFADNLAGNPGTGDSGIADVSVDTGGGFVDTGLNVTLGANASPDLTTTDLETNSTVSFQFTVANDDDTIRILYNGLAGNGGDSFGINGFEVTAVPEPTHHRPTWSWRARPSPSPPQVTAIHIDQGSILNHPSRSQGRLYATSGLGWHSQSDREYPLAGRYASQEPAFRSAI